MKGELFKVGTLTENMLDFIGSSFETDKGGVVTVTGVAGKDKFGCAYFNVNCSLCSEDKELYDEGSFITTKHTFNRGIIPCACSLYLHNKNQLLIIIQRLLVNTGSEFVSWGSKTKSNGKSFTLKCKEGHITKKTLGNLRQGKICKECGYKSTGDFHRTPLSHWVGVLKSHENYKSHMSI